MTRISYRGIFLWEKQSSENPKDDFPHFKTQYTERDKKSGEKPGKQSIFIVDDNDLEPVYGHITVFSVMPLSLLESNAALSTTRIPSRDPGSDTDTERETESAGSARSWLQLRDTCSRDRESVLQWPYNPFHFNTVTHFRVIQHSNDIYIHILNHL